MIADGIARCLVRIDAAMFAVYTHRPAPSTSANDATDVSGHLFHLESIGTIKHRPHEGGSWGRWIKCRQLSGHAGLESSAEFKAIILEQVRQPGAPESIRKEIQRPGGTLVVYWPLSAAQQCPRRRPLPEHLRRVEHHHEPKDTHPTPGCGRTMVRVGEDISEKLDIVPAEFFVHRHIYAKWAC